MNKAILAFLLILPLLIFGQRSELSKKYPEADYTREALIRLAEDGSEKSYREIERMLAELNHDHPLFASEEELGYGYRKGLQAIETAITIIGDRGNEVSYRVLEKVMRNNLTNRRGLSIEIWRVTLSNLLKYREAKSEELVELIRDAIAANNEKNELLLEDYPFVEQEGIYYSFMGGRYVDGSGEVVFKGHANKRVSYGPLIRSLDVIGSKEAYELMLSFFQSWEGQEASTLFELPVTSFRTKRYDPEIINMYNALFRDERHYFVTRRAIIHAFFSNDRDYFPAFTSVDIDNPKEFFPQLDELDQDRLLRILELADYALSRDFLTQKTVDLIKSTRVEILKLLSAMGYKHEVAIAQKAIEEVAEPEPATEENEVDQDDVVNSVTAPPPLRD